MTNCAKCLVASGRRHVAGDGVRNFGCEVRTEHSREHAGGGGDESARILLRDIRHPPKLRLGQLRPFSTPLFLSTDQGK